MKILHSVEGRDIEQGCSTSKQISRVCDCSLSLTCVYILHALIVYIHYLLDILVLKLIYAWIVCSHLYSIKRGIAAPQLLSGVRRGEEKILHLNYLYFSREPLEAFSGVFCAVV